jgi:hypothetical protein
MIAASPIECFPGAGDHRRASLSYYLSRFEQGRSKLTYVTQQELAAVRRKSEDYSAFLLSPRTPPPSTGFFGGNYGKIVIPQFSPVPVN